VTCARIASSAVSTEPEPARPLQPNLDRNVEQDGEVGPQAGRGEVLEQAHLVGVVAVAGALVGQRRVDEARADDPLAPLQGRADDARHVLGAAGGVQQRVGPGVEIVAHAPHVEHDAAHLVAEWRAARLVGQEGGDATLAQPLGEVARGGRLAAALGTLQGDEPAALGRPPAHRQRPPSSGMSSTRRFGSEPRERDMSALRSAIWCCRRRT
jgi:hypothetical protein